MESLGSEVSRSVGNTADSKTFLRHQSAYLFLEPLLTPRVERAIFVCDVAARRTSTISVENQINAVAVALSLSEVFVVDGVPTVIFRFFVGDGGWGAIFILKNRGYIQKNIQENEN